MSRYPIYAQKAIVGESEWIKLYGTDDTTFTYNDVPVMGQGGGVTTLNPIGASPNANGATIAGNVLNLQPASAAFGGVVTNAAQTLAGAKTLSATLTLGADLTLDAAAKVNVGVTPLIRYPNDYLFVGKGSGNATLSGSDCVGVGSRTCQSLTSAVSCTAVGVGAASAVTSGADTTAIGTNSCLVLTSGNRNTGCGAYSLRNLTTGTENTCFGAFSGQNYTGNETLNCCIASEGVVGDNNTIRVGNTFHNLCFIRGINGVTVAGATAAVINASGQLGTTVSSRKRKREIEAIPKEDYYRILGIETKRFKMVDDRSDEVYYGAIAEEVVEKIPEMVVLDDEKNPVSIQYEKFIAPLIALVQEQQKRIDTLEMSIKTIS